MKNEDQVCNFEQAEKIAGHGIKLKTQWMWWKTIVKGDPVTLIPTNEITGKLGEFISAPTVAELGVLLPKSVEIDKSVYHLYTTKPKAGGFLVEYTCNYNDLVSIYKTYEAEARVDALIWLVENGYLKAKDLRL